MSQSKNTQEDADSIDVDAKKENEMTKRKCKKLEQENDRLQEENHELETKLADRRMTIKQLGISATEKNKQIASMNKEIDDLVYEKETLISLLHKERQKNPKLKPDVVKQESPVVSKKVERPPMRFGKIKNTPVETEYTRKSKIGDTKVTEAEGIKGKERDESPSKFKPKEHKKITKTVSWEDMNKDLQKLGIKNPHNRSNKRKSPDILILESPKAVPKHPHGRKNKNANNTVTFGVGANPAFKPKGVRRNVLR